MEVEEVAAFGVTGAFYSGHGIIGRRKVITDHSFQVLQRPTSDNNNRWNRIESKG